MIFSRAYIPFQCIYGFDMLRQRLTRLFKQFNQKAKLLVRGYAGGLKDNITEKDFLAL